jgi:hypothetical protein
MAVGEIGGKQGFKGPLSRCCQDHTVRLEVMVVAITVEEVVGFPADDSSVVEEEIGAIGVAVSVDLDHTVMLQKQSL